jgi:hypothetical protein
MCLVIAFTGLQVQQNRNFEDPNIEKGNIRAKVEATNSVVSQFHHK